MFSKGASYIDKESLKSAMRELGMLLFFVCVLSEGVKP
jgi:hypothetical protein